MGDPRLKGLALPGRIRVLDVGATTIEHRSLERLVSSPVWIYRGHLTAVYGHPGTMKTFTVLYMAVPAALSGNAVLWFAGEGSCDALLRRIDALARGLGESREAFGNRFTLVHGALDILEAANDRFVEELSVRLRPDLVVLDPMASFYVGEENSASAMRPFLAQLHAWIEVGTAVVLIHHSRKASEGSTTELRGSSALKGAVDSVFAVTRPTAGEAIVKIIHEKARDEEPQKTREVKFEFKDDGRVIVSTTGPAEHSAPESDSNEEQLLATLAQAQEPPTRQELRVQLKWSGHRTRTTIDSLLCSGKVAEVEVQREDMRGHFRKSTAYRLTTAGTASDGRTSS